MIFRLIFQISQSFLGDTLMKYYLFYGKSWMLIMWTYKGWHNYLFCPYFNSLTSFLSFFYSFTHSRNTDSLSVPMYLSWSHCRASELDISFTINCSLLLTHTHVYIVSLSFHRVFTQKNKEKKIFSKKTYLAIFLKYQPPHHHQFISHTPAWFYSSIFITI